MGRRYDTLLQVNSAWRAKDSETVLSFMADDIVWHYAAAAMPPATGKAAASKLLERLKRDMHDIQWRVFHYAETEDRLFVEGVDEYTTSDGRRVAAPYAGIYEFRDDLIIGWRDYVDLGVIAAQQGGEPSPRQVNELLDRPVCA